MNCSDDFFAQYAKKILGFAYLKTRNVFEAEDLAQEILLQLAKSLAGQSNINDLDGYVYTVCCYTWAKFLRGNKRHWRNLSIEDFSELQDSRSIEKDAEQAELIERLRAEVAYLSRLHRQITVMFYYEGKSASDIAAVLKLPSGTVYWHLSEIRRKIREGIEMRNSSLSVKPQRLMFGIWGNCVKDVGLGYEYTLANSIVIACYGNALSIEEIARTLSVAAAYLESVIDSLVFMDYLKVVNKNRYTTNFAIKTWRDSVILGMYHKRHISPYAGKIYSAFERRFEAIRKIGFVGSDLNKDFLLWALIPVVVYRLSHRAYEAISVKNNVKLEPPMRKDGSRHWVIATLRDDDWFDTQTEFLEEEILFWRKSDGNGIKPYNEDEGDCGLMLESYYSNKFNGGWREFEKQEINELLRIADIIRSNAKPNDYDKLAISKHIERGFAVMENGRPRLMIPVFTQDEFERFNVICNEIIGELGEDLFVPYMEGYASIAEEIIPAFLPAAERDFHKYMQCVPDYIVLYCLNDAGMLRTPSDEESRRLCTVVWREAANK